MNPLHELIEITDPRAFLKKALLVQARTKVSLSQFSKQAGFTSRSFLSEYISAKKKLSIHSLESIKSALKLPREYKQLFSLLVKQDQPELLRPKNLIVSKEIAKIKSSLRNQNRIIKKIPKAQSIIGKRDLFLIFSALGSESQGSCISDITNKTKLSSDKIQAGLNLLLEQNLIEIRDNRVYVSSSKVDFLHFRGNELVHLTKDVCGEIQKESTRLVKQEGCLIFYTAMSIKKSQQLQFKERLRESLYSVIDEFQDDDGDCIQEIFLCSKN